MSIDSAQEKAALAFAGGGFLSVAVQASLTSGLLAVNTRKTGGKSPTTVQGSKLLERFEVVSAISGGSWFSCELIYSERFLKLIESMAFTPAEAGVQFDHDWVEGWLSIGKANPAILRIVADLAGLAQRPVLRQTILEVGYILSTGFNWNNFVETLLRTTASIDGNIPMGSDVLRWAQGKTWIVGSSLALPTGQNDYKKVTLFPAGGGRSRNRVSYAATATTEGACTCFPVYVPARFNIQLGAGIDAPAPLQYVSSDAIPPTTALKYSGSGFGEGLFGWCHTQSFNGTTAALGHFDNMNYFPGYLPLGQAVACSSSFLGDIALLPSEGSGDAFTALAQALNGDLSTWAGSGAHEKGLSQANSLVGEIYSSQRVTQTTFDGLVENAVQLTIDGAFTDNTGVANAIAAGATDVVAIVNSTGTDQAEEPDDLFNLFSSDSQHVRKRNRFLTKKSLESEPVQDPCDASMEMSFEIFKNTQADAREQYAEIAKTGTLKIDSGDSQQLISIVVGSFKHIKTKSDVHFGVEGGRHVNLHLISVTSKLDIGRFVNYHDYSTLVQEIINTLLNADNSTFVEGTMLPLFLPGRKSEKVESKAADTKWRAFGA